MTKQLKVALVAFVVGLLLVGALLFGNPLFYDNDSYYHLAIARAFAQDGWSQTAQWLSESLRTSILGTGFGDKEFGYHLYLSLFSHTLDPLLGGKIAHTLLLAAIFATVAGIASGYLGWWAVLLPVFLTVCSTEVTWRLVRVRPETLALLLFLLALWLAGRGRYRWLALIAFVFTLSYTAFHAFLGLFVLMCLFRVVVRQRFEPQLVLYPALGAALALVLHPFAPDNLAIWVLQSFDFFEGTETLDVGREIFPNSTAVFLKANLGWILGLLVLLLARNTHQAEASERQRRSADAFLVAGTVFFVLYLLMSRFSIYAMTFLTLAVVLGLEARGDRPAGTLRGLTKGQPGTRPAHLLAWLAKTPTPLALVLVALVAFPAAKRQFDTYRFRTAVGPNAERLADREELARLIPQGGTVAARWQQAPIYMLWAPQGRYLNVLDPIFMARPYPELHEVQARLFRGEEPDTPFAAKALLGSEFLAYSLSSPTGDLTRRLNQDPRVRALHRDLNVLWEVGTGANRDFVLDWSAELSDGTWTPYPRSHSAPDVEGFIDTRRVEGAPSGCVRLRHKGLPFGHEGTFEFIPFGPSAITVGDTRVFGCRRHTWRSDRARAST